MSSIKKSPPLGLSDSEALDRIVAAFARGLLCTGGCAATDLLEEIARLVRLSGRVVDDGAE